MRRILFVCLGNICRSPLAEGVAQKLIDEQDISCYVESAGTGNWHEGEAPCENSVKIAQSHGIDISNKRARPVSKPDITSFDYVIAMDRQNQADLKAFGFKNVYRLGEFGGCHGEDVPDPYFFRGFEGFVKVYDMIDTCVKDIIEQVKNETIGK